jgi:hypothetical protein
VTLRILPIARPHDPDLTRIADAAERLGMPFVCLDDRVIPLGVKREATRTQARAWSEELWKAGFAIDGFDENGVRIRLPGLGVRLYPVESLRDAIRVNEGLHGRADTFRVLLVEAAIRLDLGSKRVEFRSEFMCHPPTRTSRSCSGCGSDHVAGLCPEQPLEHLPQCVPEDDQDRAIYWHLSALCVKGCPVAARCPDRCSCENGRD